MFSFLGFRKDYKKCSSERESDGFVLIGETADEKKERQQPKTTLQPVTNVIVQPSKLSSEAVALTKHPEVFQYSPESPAFKPSTEALHTDGPPVLSELLGDIPFTLAPHILAMQSGQPQLHDLTLPLDFHKNMANFCYDFTLENSVLCEP